jgi:hypothetical protein
MARRTISGADSGGLGYGDWRLGPSKYGVATDLQHDFATTCMFIGPGPSAGLISVMMEKSPAQPLPLTRKDISMPLSLLRSCAIYRSVAILSLYLLSMAMLPLGHQWLLAGRGRSHFRAPLFSRSGPCVVGSYHAQPLYDCMSDELGPIPSRRIAEVIKNRAHHCHASSIQAAGNRVR